MAAPTMIVIINPGARGSGGPRKTERLAELFQSRGIDARIQIGGSGAEIVELARRAANSESAVVVAGGGDGTISAVASALIDGNKALGVLPLGTLNHFAKDLNIPLEVEAAVEVIARRNIASVDVGEVNGRYFLNNSSLGLYPRMVAERKQQQTRGWSKWAAFFSAMLIAIHRYPLLTVRLDADGKELVRRTPMIFIGNNPYELQGVTMGSRRCLNMGTLFLYVTRQESRWSLLWTALNALFGKLHEAGDFDAMCVEELRVQTRRRRLRVGLDGEVAALKTPLRYRIHPAALRVIVPPAATGR